ncbi:MAG TPA: hypothetical protein VHM69_17460 [Rubrobacter sp.]|nr:hypothetical protein [Rubrobacter sp.]
MPEGTSSQGQMCDEELARSDCEVAVHMTRRLGLGTGVQCGLNEIYERWDSKGNPRKLSGEDIALPARFAQVASQEVLFECIGGPDLASEMISRRAGAALDPSIAETFLKYSRELLAEIITADAAVAVIGAGPHRRIAEPRLDEVARAFAELVDLKSPFMHGHSSLTIPRTKQVRRRRGLEVTPARQRSIVANLSPKNA